MVRGLYIMLRDIIHPYHYTVVYLSYICTWFDAITTNTRTHTYDIQREAHTYASFVARLRGVATEKPRATHPFDVRGLLCY